jgi:hypothetical protein
MSRLPIAVSDCTDNREPPRSWEAFEELCTDVFPLIQDELGIEREGYVKSWLSSGYGKVGNKQWGVDVFDYFSTATIQCKRVEKFTEANLLAELELLKDYPHRISVHFIITSLDETDRSVQDYIRLHNADLVSFEGDRWPRPEVPESRLPMLLELNWQGLKRILAKDFFLASKWGLFPYQGRYANLNGLDINALERAVRTRHCFLSSGYGRKRPHVLEAIRRITQVLNVYEIESIGKTHVVLTRTVESMLQFVWEVREALHMAKQFNKALEACESLDNYSRHQALAKLDEIAVYYQRIDAFKYLRRLYDSVRRLSNKLNDGDYYFHLEDEVEFKDGSTGPLERSWERRYRFVEDQHDEFYPSLSRFWILQEARFIVSEILNVREERKLY